MDGKKKSMIHTVVNIANMFSHKIGELSTEYQGYQIIENKETPQPTADEVKEGAGQL